MLDNIYPVAMDRFFRLPEKVREILAASPEMTETFAPIDATPIEAGLNTVGLLRGVFIENGGTIPTEAVSPYVVVIELA